MSAEASPRRYLVTVYGRLPVLNQVLRMKRMARHTSLTRWQEWTIWALRAEGVPRLGRVHIVCTRYAPGTRQPDPDGLAGGFKPCLDALQGTGVIPNDDAAHVQAEYVAVRCPAGDARIEMVIEGWA